MYTILDDWNPFGIGEGNYDTEIADAIQAVHSEDNGSNLAVKIQSIYEFSFEKLIPIEECEKIAAKLLEVKSQGTCAL